MQFLYLEGISTDLIIGERNTQFTCHCTGQGHGDGSAGAQAGGHGNRGMNVNAEIRGGFQMQANKQAPYECCQRICGGE